MRLPHIAILPYLTCNFRCSYCVAKNFNNIPLFRQKDSFKSWDKQFDDTATFLNTLDEKAVMVSGGEPFIWKRWGELMEKTDHYWYFITNASDVPRWLGYSTVKDRAKLFIATFHKTGIRIEEFIANIRKIQDLGYPVFVKVL